MKYNFNKNFKKGFTLVETLVAISIFSASLLAVMAVLSSGIASTNYTKTKLTASYLAQEGIEFIRNMRDTYVLYDVTSAQNGWNTFNTKLTGASCQTTGCYFDDQSLDYNSRNQAITLITPVACGGPCPQLKYDSVTGKYGYNNLWQNTVFTRKISITPIAGGNEVKVTSTVSWTQGSGSYTEVFSENLFNWVE
ncbi:MAG: type II secretion system protein [Candidatus Paceibacterota bacterium]